jgi:spermidine synthase
MRSKNQGLISVLFVLFLISGATGLAYEIIWTRLLIRIFGATSFAVTTVLASYMAGLALGSYLFGRLIDRRGNPARIYGLLQLGIAIFAVVFPFILAMLNPLYGKIYPALQDNYYTLTTVRFVLCFVVLLIPTTLMGGTLPVLSKFIVTNLSHLTRRVGSLYAVNTAGAVLGTFLTGFFVLPALGIRNTTWACALINMAICAIALFISMRFASTEFRREGIRAASGGGTHPSTTRTQQSPDRSKDRLILTTFALTGFFALAVEVIWARVLSLVIGTTVYAFSIMLTTFLLGLAAGSAVFARIAQPTERPGRILGYLVAAIGLAVYASSVAFGKLPIIYMHYYDAYSATWGNVVWLEFLLSTAIMFVPAFLMGGVFPLIARLYARDVMRVGSEIGTVYAFNTIGSICGSFAGSFILLRFLGVEKALALISAGYVALGIVLLVTISGYLKAVARIGVAAGLIAVAVAMFGFAPRWNRKIMTSGVYRYAELYRTVEGLKEAAIWRNILYYDEGPGATVSVERNQDELALIIDGKADASTGITDMTTQLLLAHLPLLFHPDPDTVLVIGLGGGVTLGSAATHDVSHIDCVELLDNVVEAADYFKSHTYDCLADPRVEVIVGDARNHILLTDRSYDVVISQPPNPWISGVGDLFTREFFEMMSRRLKPGGIICNWLHIYHMGDEDLRSTVASYLAVFPHVTLWMITETDVIMLGSSAPFAFDEHLLAKMKRPAVASDLERIWIDDVGDITSLLVTDSAGLRPYAEGAEVHTDDNMMLEFSAAKKVFESTENIHVENFLGIMKPAVVRGLEPQETERFLHHIEGRKLALRGTVAEADGRVVEAIAHYDTAYAIAPTNQFVTLKYIEGHLTLADALMRQHQYDQALYHYRHALVDPDYPRSWAIWRGLANYAIAKQDYRSAYENLRASLRQNPFNAMGHYRLGHLEHAAGNITAAVHAFEQAVRLAPDYPEASDALARVYLEAGINSAAALDLARRSASMAETAGHLNTLAWAYDKTGRQGKAEDNLHKALRLDPSNTETLYRLALVRLKQGDTDEYRNLLEKIVNQGGDDRYSREARSLLRALK